MKKLISGLLSLALLVTALLIPVGATEAETIRVGEQSMTFTQFVADYATHAAAEVTLLADVDASALTAPLAEFSGTLNGAGFAITNLSVGLFEGLNGATVKNLTLKGCVGSADEMYQFASHIGALAGNSKGDTTITNCVNEVEMNVRLTGDQKGVAGFIGNVDSGNLKIASCANNAAIRSINLETTTNERPWVSGFVGVMTNGALNMIACVNNGIIEIELIRNGVGMVSAAAGFLARMNGNAGVTLTKCVNYGKVSRPATSMSVVRLENFKNGGFIGSARGKGGIVMESCVNYGEICGGTATASVGIGGLIGEVKDAFSINNCYNFGAITNNPGHYAGGFIGDLNNSANCSITNSVSLGANLSETKSVAGTFVGKLTAGSLTLKGNVAVNAGDLNPVGTGEAAESDTASYADEAAWKAATTLQNQVYVQSSAAANGVFNVRFISTLPSVEGYANAGFEIIRICGGEKPETVGGANVTVKTVYESLTGTNAEGKTVAYTPADLASTEKYFSAAVVNNVPADTNVVFIVKPYLVNADTGAVISGVATTVAFSNGVLVQS